MQNFNSSPKLTARALQKIQNLQEAKANPNLKLRVYIEGGGCNGFTYQFKLDDQVNANDQVFAELLIDSLSLQFLNRAEIDHLENLYGAKFIVNNPDAETTCSCGASFS